MDESWIFGKIERNKAMEMRITNTSQTDKKNSRKTLTEMNERETLKNTIEKIKTELIAHVIRQ